MKKNTVAFNPFGAVTALMFLLVSWGASSQIYVHDFGTEFITEYPYTTAPDILHPDLSNSQWTNNTGAWVSFVGVTGEALGLSNASGAASVTLTLQVAPGRELDIESFSFWGKRTPSGPQNWAMAINGIAVGNGTSTTAGGFTGTLPVANEVSGLTGTVSIVISLNTSLGVGSFMIDDFTLNGTLSDAPIPCTPPQITGLSPLSGPAGTLVTITGNGFEAGTGTASVQFNGVDAGGYSVISDTVIEAIVPPTAATGPVTITTDGCTAGAGIFTVSASDCPETSGPADLYISELYDHVPGSYGVIELYNPTGNTITFNGQYILERYGDIGGGSPSYTLVLPGSIGPESTFLVQSYGTGVMGCSVVANASMGQGINGNDEFKLKKNNIIIDVAHAPSGAGYSVIRQPDAIAPSEMHSNSDWTFGSNNCGDLGNHTADPLAPTASITLQPQDESTCEGGEVMFSVAVSNPAGFIYQWKTTNESGNWVNVVNSPVISGAGTATLTISSTPQSMDGSQFYCEISLASCTLVSNAVQLSVIPAPAIATTTVTQPTCTVPTGTITVTTPTGAGLTYSLDGTDFQAETAFAGLAPGTYTVTVQNADGCTSETGDIIINAIPNAPAVATTTVMQPACTVPTGTITVTAPTGAGLTYSLDGIDFQAETVFAGLAPGTYTVTVQNADGCTSETGNIIINAIPNAPAVATTAVTQPTCTLSTGTITITAPTGAGLTYSLDGINFQTETVFAGLAPGTYTVTMQNADGCTSETGNLIINEVPNAPAVATTTVMQPACTVPTGTITVTAPTGAGFTYSLDGTNFQTETAFAGLVPGIYTMTAQNADGCISVTGDIAIAGAPGLPMITSIQECREGSFGSRYILEALPLDSSFDTSSASFEWKTAQGVTVGFNENTFNVTEYAADSNIPADAFPLEFTLTVTTAEGCQASHVYTVESIFCSIPKGISPNNDGLNDSFDITALNVKKLVIFNRYGKQVYSRNNYRNEWYGQSDNGEELPTGTYYYIIDAQANPATGWVYINRQD